MGGAILLDAAGYAVPPTPAMDEPAEHHRMCRTTISACNQRGRLDRHQPCIAAGLCAFLLTSAITERDTGPYEPFISAN
jgi:hypothetical protein